jgi:autotransporter-associated beta strand protein
VFGGELGDGLPLQTLHRGGTYSKYEPVVQTKILVITADIEFFQDMFPPATSSTPPGSAMMPPNPARFRMRPRLSLSTLARAVALAAGLAIGGAQAEPTSQIYQLGISPAAKTLESGTDGLLPWIAKGSLPPGSILRSISVDAKIEDVGTDGTTDDWASQLSVYLDPSPDAPGTAALLQVGGYGKLGTVSIALTDTSSNGWSNGQAGPPATVIDTISEAAWAPLGEIDLNTVSVSLGNDYSQASWSGSVTIVYDIPQAAAIKTFGPGAVISPLVGNAGTISWLVPSTADVTALAPTFTLSSGTCDRDNGGPATYDFTTPVVYTVTDGAIVNTYTVTVTKATALVWDLVTGGAWDLETDNWRGLVSGEFAVFANGNEAIFDNPAGGTIDIAPGMAPLSTTVSAASGNYTFSGGPLAGTGSLVKSGNGTLTINPADHTFSGGTTLNGGKLLMEVVEARTGLGSGPVTLNGGQFHLNRFTCANDLVVTGGSIILDNGFGSAITGDIANTAPNLEITAWYTQHPLSGSISGPGGFTLNSVAGGGVTLSGTNSYTGTTTVASGTLQCNNPAALGSGALSIGTGGAKVNLNFTESKAVAALILGGVEQTATGSYGSPTSDATFKSNYFSGNGMVTTGDPASAAYITSFGTNVAGSAAVIGAVAANSATITWYVPAGTNLANLAPAFEVTSGATCSDQTSGVIPTPGFGAGPVAYTIVSQNTLVTNTFTVEVEILPTESVLIWNLAGGGEWNRTSPNWRGQSSGLPSPYFDGVHVVFENTGGGTILLKGDLSPLSTTVNAASGTYTFGVAVDGGAVTTGSLTKDGGGTLQMSKANTYDGGTIVNAGTLNLSWPGDGVPRTTLGSGLVTLNDGTLFLNRVDLANPLTVNGGSLIAENGFANTWSGPITLNAPNLNVTAYYSGNHTFSGDISGSGGMTLSSVAGGGLVLSGTNTYTGTTRVNGGTLRFNSPQAVAPGELIISSGGAKVNLNFNGTKAVASLTLGGELKTAFGTYGSEASGATFKDDNFFSGTGTVTLGDVVSDYAAWLGGFTFAEGADTSPTGDPDGDGMTNQQEYAFGLNPTLGSSNNPIVEPLDPATGNFQYTRRATPAATGLAYNVLTSTDLDEWTSGGATETGFTTAGDIQTVTVNVTTPPVGGKLFVQVQALSAP